MPEFKTHTRAVEWFDRGKFWRLVSQLLWSKELGEVGKGMADQVQKPGRLGLGELTEQITKKLDA